MVERRVYATSKQIHFGTRSCDNRRNHLQHEQARRIVIGTIGSRLAQQQGLCRGFVIMPDHVDALIWFPETWQLSPCLNKWKEQTSKSLKTVLPQRFQSDWPQIDSTEPIWQARYYGFNIGSRAKVEEKLDDMHRNPVRAGLVERASDWPWSSARWYVEQKSAGLPIRWPPGLEADDEFTTDPSWPADEIASCAYGTRPPSTGGRAT
ncbi:REP-associated tyrosine transposase [Schlesneria sp. T3-172]|uniref:REP-associated tyrosine transposase n=1 Tax=Schlesneria sphaerica TaxID=3373610 RepID=UPI0037CB96F7